MAESSLAEIMAGPLVHETLLQRRFGLGKDEAATAAALYLRIPPAHRPQLSLYVDPAFYLERYPDIAAAGMDPLVHVAHHGAAEGRAPHPLVDIGFMQAQQPDLLAGPDPLPRLVAALDTDGIRPSPYFDAAHYAAEAARHGLAPPEGAGLFRHFLAEGLAAGLTPNPFLDPVAYARDHADLPLDPLRALAHFVLRGDAEGRAASDAFDGRAYLERYPDVLAAGMPALLHFLTLGRAERRTAVGRLSRPRARFGAGEGPTADARPDPPDILAERRAWQAVREGIARQRQARIEGFAEGRVTPIRIEEGEAALRQAISALRFAEAEPPVISILIPMRDELRLTLECLASLRAHAPSPPHEVVIADDASTDPLMGELARIPGLRLLRQAQNLGFLRNCNAGFAACRGRFVLLLNNDTQILPGAIDQLHAALERDPRAAAAGPKLVYPNGRLQEAGCHVGSDGVSGMVGLFDDPARPAFNHARPVHYCSGAALLLRREAAGEALFDEGFAPAYCEDADLCLRFWAAGRPVLYVPEAVVAHHLSVSTAKESQARKMQTVLRNQQRLAEKWGDQLRAMNRVRVLAFYLPQFHPTPENDLWWGPGFTEWTNVARALPSYAGHYQPHLPADLGFYDLRVTEVAACQAALARRYGVAGFCVYYYNFGGRRVLDRAFEAVVADPGIDFPFCIAWANENWTGHWDGGDRRVLLEQDYAPESLESVCADFLRHARDPRYIRVRGRPLFVLYRPMLLPDPAAFAALLRRRAEAAGIGGVHLAYVEGMELAEQRIRPAELGFDAAIEFPPQARAAGMEDTAIPLKPGWQGRRYDYERTILNFTGRLDADYTRYPGVFPGWDNTPRQPLLGTSFDRASPAAFQAFCEAKLDETREFLTGDDRLLFVNAWNEWAEGAHLEPDQRHGHRWLEALHAAMLSRGVLA